MGEKSLICTDLVKTATASIHASSISISGVCKEGTYEGTFSITPTSKACWNVACDGKCVPSGSVTLNVKYTFNFKKFIDIRETQGFDFGEIIKQPNDQTVMMSVDGKRSGCLSTRNEGQVGLFDIQAIPNSEIDVSLDPTVTLYATQGTSSTSATLFHDASNNKMVTGQDGKTVLRVGGALSVPSTLNAGDYSGNYNVRISY